MIGLVRCLESRHAKCLKNGHGSFQGHPLSLGYAVNPNNVFRAKLSVSANKW